MSQKLLSCTLSVVCLLLAGCSGTSTGNGLGTSTGNGLVSVSMTLQRSDALCGVEPVVVSDAGGESFEFNQARVGVRDIDFYLAEGVTCNELSLDLQGPVTCDGDKVRVAGPFVVDLLTGESWPDLSGLTIPAGDYRRVDVRFDDAREDWGLVEATDPLLGNSFALEGVIVATGELFRVTVDVNVEARYINEQAQLLPEDAPASVLLTLNPEQWFAALPISECIAEGEFTRSGEVILIQDSGSNCQEIENALKHAIRDSGSLQINP
jgi:hypothetical protein